MTENDSPQPGDSDDFPEPVIEGGRSLSPVWVIPIVAALVASGHQRRLFSMVK